MDETNLDHFLAHVFLKNIGFPGEGFSKKKKCSWLEFVFSASYLNKFIIPESRVMDLGGPWFPTSPENNKNENYLIAWKLDILTDEYIFVYR